MKKLALLLFLLSAGVLANGQEIKKNLSTFRHLVASPWINVILSKGESEHIRLVYANVDESKINIEVDDKTLRLYLTDARIAEKSIRTDWEQYENMYKDAIITAYVTYTTLESIDIRGNQELTCLDPIRSEQFTLHAYGENEITLAYLKTERFKMALYGENKVRILDGKVDFQKCKLFGENLVDTRRMRSYTTLASSYGTSKVKVNTEDEVRFNSFGESELTNVGAAPTVRGIMIGDTKVRHSN